MTTQTGHFAVLKNSNGSLDAGRPHKTTLCAIAGISMWEGREFVGIYTAEADYVGGADYSAAVATMLANISKKDINAKNLKSGMRVVLDHAQEIKFLHESLEASQLELKQAA